MRRSKSVDRRVVASCMPPMACRAPATSSAGTDASQTHTTCRPPTHPRTYRVHHRAGQGAGDAVDQLDLRDDHAAELVDRRCLGPQDHVVRPGHVVGLHDARKRTHRRDDVGALPTSVWMRMYELTVTASPRAGTAAWYPRVPSGEPGARRPMTRRFRRIPAPRRSISHPARFASGTAMATPRDLEGLASL